MVKNWWYQKLSNDHSTTLFALFWREYLDMKDQVINKWRGTTSHVQFIISIISTFTCIVSYTKTSIIVKLKFYAILIQRSFDKHIWIYRLILKECNFDHFNKIPNSMRKSKFLLSSCNVTAKKVS